MAPKKVAIVGSGNWGSAIARIVGSTTKANPNMFDQTINMWVFEEMVDGKKLSEVINTTHENIKYLPGKKLPENVVAVTNVVETCKDADILIFVIPHQFVTKVCNDLKGKVKTDAVAISLIKGLSTAKCDGIKLVSSEIKEILNVEIAVLMGANLAPEVANDNYCEATIGIRNKSHGEVLKTLFHTDNFRINVVQDIEAVELCGALKNIVACAAGFSDGLGYGDNTKAAIIRLGMMEIVRNIVACAAGFSDGLGYGDNTKAAIIRLGMMEIVRFVNQYYPGAHLSTFFESCGLADLVTTCYGGRNRRVCEAYVKSDKSLKEVEKELLNGQSAQGPLTAEEVVELLKKTNSESSYPLFVAVDKICKNELKPKDLIDCLRSHPEHE
uniref:Glycerol-3-phosphate dehydrogenase [NAD(+)] n=1 Tax=Panagrolaimus sp. PS1159 TaxID=55785 RepID=A0AC35G5E5_9BILA